MDYINLVNRLGLINFVPLIIIGVIIGVAYIALITLLPSRWYDSINLLTWVVTLSIIALIIYDSNPKRLVSYEVSEEVVTLNSMNDISEKKILVNQKYVKLTRTEDTTYDSSKKLEKPIATLNVVKFKVKNRFYTNKTYINKELSKPYYVLKRLEY